ncbi:MAG: hypothetical protein RLZZ182_1922 [Pseudomonadota bacterium]|jgi:hypothetical protein
MTLEEQLHAGSRAREVLENEAFIAAFETIEKDVLEQWTNSPARDAEGREKCWTYLMLLRKVKAQLQSTMEGGKLAQVELTHKQSIRERLQARWNGMSSSDV